MILRREEVRMICKLNDFHSFSREPSGLRKSSFCLRVHLLILISSPSRFFLIKKLLDSITNTAFATATHSNNDGMNIDASWSGIANKFIVAIGERQASVSNPSQSNGYNNTRILTSSGTSLTKPIQSRN